MKLNRILSIASTLFLCMCMVSVANAQKSVKLSDKQIEDIVKRSYQYVAMYNVNQKVAFDEEGMSTKGYNKGLKNTDLLDHTAEFIARPNNDTMYQTAMLDLRKDAVVFKFPADQWLRPLYRNPPVNSGRRFSRTQNSAFLYEENGRV